MARSARKPALCALLVLALAPTIARADSEPPPIPVPAADQLMATAHGLAGHDHVDNPHDVMSPYYIYPTPECGGQQATGAPSPDAASQRSASPASSKKAKRRAVKRKKATKRKARPVSAKRRAHRAARRPLGVRR